MKTKSLKGLLSVLLALIMLISLIPMSVMAATYSPDGNITSTEFTLKNFAYGELVMAGNATNSENVAVINSTKFYESDKETPTNPNELDETTDSFFKAGKQYYCAVDFSEDPTLEDGVYFDRSLTAKLNCNGVSCEKLFDLSGNSKVFVYKLPILDVIPFGIDVTTVVEQGGNIVPKKGEFELEISNSEERSNNPIENFTIDGKEISTNGKGKFENKLTIANDDYGKSYMLFVEGIYVKQKKGNAEGWTYDDSVWYVTFQRLPSVNALNDEVETMPNITYDCYKGKIVDGEFIPDSETPAEKITFTNTYTENKTEPTPTTKEPEKTPTPQEPATSPKTGDNSAMVVLFALLTVSGLGVTATIIGKKKSVR